MHERQPSTAPLFTQVDISAGQIPDAACAGTQFETEQLRLLRAVLAAQDRQNDLLEELISHLSATQKQRSQELGHWKAANPHLASSCRRAAETLSKVQTEFLQTLTEEVADQGDAMADGEFVLNEFIDRFGPRLAHLNGVLQVLSHLGGTT